MLFEAHGWRCGVRSVRAGSGTIICTSAGDARQQHGFSIAVDCNRPGWRTEAATVIHGGQPVASVGLRCSNAAQ